MKEEITYKLSKEDFQSVIEETLASQIEEKVYNRFEHVIIDTKTACNILKISDRTLYSYIKSKMIDVEPKVVGGENRFRLSEILKVNIPNLRKQLRYGNLIKSNQL